MTVTPTRLGGVLVVEPRLFCDDRGSFMETFNVERYAQAGIDVSFVQDNVSRSIRGALRGLHFQAPPHGQAKLVSVVEGTVYDVAVDLRTGSPTYGEWVGVELTADNRCQLFVPVGFAHGFAVTSEQAVLSYKCSAEYAPQAEGAVAWDDPDLAIEWPVAAPLLSDKDAAAPPLAALESPFSFAQRVP